MAAYAHHALVLGSEDASVYAFFHEALEALLAIHMGQPDFNFRGFATEATAASSRVTSARVNLWEKIIFNSPDPLEHLYRVVVPRNMTRDVFIKLFGALTVRSENPSQQARHIYMDKLRARFDIVEPDSHGAVR